MFPALKHDGWDLSLDISFISKIIENILDSQLTFYLNVSGLLPVLQSGFLRDHSTDTCLVYLLLYSYNATDRAQVTLLHLVR